MVTILTTTAWQLIAAVIVSSFALVIYLGSKKRSSQAFLMLLIFTIIWMFFSSVLPPAKWVESSFLVDHYLGGLIAASFFYFCLLYPEDGAVSRWITGGIIVLELALIPLYYFDLIGYGTFYFGANGLRYSHDGPLWFLRDITFVGFATAGLYILFRKYRRASDEKARLNLGFIFWGMVATLVPNGLVIFVLPHLGFPDFEWISPFTVLACISVIFYSIVRHQQMDVKAVTSEIFVLMMAIMLFANIFLDGSAFGTAGKVSIFFAFIFLGYLFIKSILKETAQKEQLEDLNENLNAKVVEQTTKIRASYEAEKKARIEIEKANEELKELDKRKTEFLSIVAHQLRTPLSGIKWAITMLLRGKLKPPSADQKKLILLCEKGNERMIAIVNQMLRAARIGENGISEINLEATDIVALISDVINESRLTAAEHETAITFTHEGTIPSLMIDREMIRLAVQNLLENAIRYSHSPSTVLINIKVQGTQVQCSIADNGIGIPADQQPYIFSRFLRARNAMAADPNGSGLGLFIAKSILEGHGGTIWFTSEENKGTTFYFTLNV